MNFRTLIFGCLLLIYPTRAGSGHDKINWKQYPKETKCLTGYMTDVQTWVDAYGNLGQTNNITPYQIVVSSRFNIMRRVQRELANFKCTSRKRIKYMSMSKCKLSRVPPVFRMTDGCGRSLAETIEYITFYGNNFGNLDSDADMYDVKLIASGAKKVNVDITAMRRQLTMWSVGFHGLTFNSLKEIDLRACSIQAVGNHTFLRMPQLKSVYLGENNIHYIEASTFTGISTLNHLDLSRNYAYDEIGQEREMVLDSFNIFENTSLNSLDLSFTNFGQRNIGVLKSIEHSLMRLSLCYSGLNQMRDVTYNFSSLKYLDVSGNSEILCSQNLLRGLNSTLQVLYAEDVLLDDMDCFEDFTKLEILKLNNNEITAIQPKVASTLRNLQVLDLDNNRMTSWFTDIFNKMKKLKLLSLKNNNINVITQEMYSDIENLSYIGLSGNFLVCNCQARDIYEVGLKSEFLRQAKYIIPSKTSNYSSDLDIHRGFADYNTIIRNRKNITTFCKERGDCDFEFNSNVSGKYFLLDYDENINLYECLQVVEGRTTAVFKLASCYQSKRDFDMLGEYHAKWNRFLLLIIPGVLLPMIFVVYVLRKNLWYFIITMRNSAMLSLINKNEVTDDGAIFNYDVFVSYCNEDRSWVLDQLLPHVERDCNISVCLHERDFQVGLSILENIVSCMDRSRSIMLVISKRFLLSQWCQFEMHLAQHRLLETRREDLILILLEDIPRRLRPNTLHYLMLTKTYIVWPTEESERSLFWKRMKKSLVTHKLKQPENVSLA